MCSFTSNRSGVKGEKLVGWREKEKGDEKCGEVKERKGGAEGVTTYLHVFEDTSHTRRCDDQ